MIDNFKKQIIESHMSVGVKKTSNCKLPPQDFAYGYKVKEDKENVGIITRSWIEHMPSKPIEAKTDFIKVNKLAIEKKIFDSKVKLLLVQANKEFLKTVDIKQNIPIGKKKDKARTSTNVNTIYGKRNR